MACDTCKGTGQIRYRHVMRDDNGEERCHTLGSHLCQCRRDLPPRDGEAKWWSSEVVHREDWQSICRTVSATFEVDVEIPIDAENYRVHRTGDNVYYPATAAVILDSEEMSSLMADDLSALAQAFQRCHDKIAELDAPEALRRTA